MEDDKLYPYYVSPMHRNLVLLQRVRCFAIFYLNNGKSPRSYNQICRYH